MKIVSQDGNCLVPLDVELLMPVTSTTSKNEQKNFHNYDRNSAWIRRLNKNENVYTNILVEVTPVVI